MVDVKTLATFACRLLRTEHLPAIAAGVLSAIAVSCMAAEDSPTENLARGAKYELFPRPTYSHCTDPDDTTQLTDGQTTTEYFWTQKGTVGWQHAPYATITVDLGQTRPIGRVSMTTAAGVAGVTWPAAVWVLASDDGKTWHAAGDLVRLDHLKNGPWPEGYAIRRLVGDVNTRGRYVQFLLVPLPGGPYTFVDEVEVFRGPDALVAKEPAGEKVDSIKQFYEAGRITRGVELRFRNDAASIRQAVRKAKLPDAQRTRLLGLVNEAERQWRPEEVATSAEFRAVLPYAGGHARLFEIQADLWRTLGREGLVGWASATWDPVDPYAVPPAKCDAAIAVDTMRGEYRAGALNLANATSKPAEVRLRFEGLPESPSPGYVTLHEVAWTDTAHGVAVAAALPEARRNADGTWSVSVAPGLVRQVWLTFHVKDLPPGEHRGAIVADAEGGATARAPVKLRVWPLQFPAKTTLWLGGWSYTNGNPSYGVTRDNLALFLKHVQDRFVNAPWATSGVMSHFEFDKDAPDRVRLDTAEFDDWITQWPDARAYLVFLSVGHYSGTSKASFAGAEVGSPEFDRRVGAWISAWVAHLRTKGIAPGRLGLLIHDEPHEGSDLGPLLAWAKAIRAAQPQVLIWEDPTYHNPAAAPPELFDACNILCPNRPMWLAGGKPFEEFYRRQQQKGRTLQFYSCSGPARLLDPYSYYRLQAWHCWHVGASGSFFWALGDNSGSSSWNEYFVTAGPYTPLFIDQRTVTAAKQMEAIRESAEDYEYFVMLRDAVARAKAAGRADAAVSRAESLLADAAGEVLAAKGADGLNLKDPKDRTRADAARVKILETLAALERGR